MTAKEKAVELYEKYFYIIPSNVDSDFSDGFALKSALITVNEIIRSNPMIENYPISYSSINYWQEVKEEIKKL